MVGRAFKKKKRHMNYEDMLDSGTYVDAGEMEVVASLRDIPDIGVHQSTERKFGCLPWSLHISKHFDELPASTEGTFSPGRVNRRVQHYLKVSLHCVLKDTDWGATKEQDWTAKVSGLLVMEKWREKAKGAGDTNSAYKETFSVKFNSSNRTFKFQKKFPLPTASQERGAAALDSSPYLKNRQFKFRLEMIIHSVRKVYFPHYDFAKKTPMCNAVVKVISGKDEQQFNVNKEYLAMYSDGLRVAFDNLTRGYMEQEREELMLKDMHPDVFREFLAIIYPSRQRPHVKNLRGLLEFARMYFIPTLTAVCEQRLLVTMDSEMAITERLKLADDYGLIQLKAHILQHADPKKFDVNNLEGFSEDTLRMLIRKINQLEKRTKKREAEKRAAAGEPADANAMEVDAKAGTSSGRRHPARHRRTHRH